MTANWRDRLEPRRPTTPPPLAAEPPPTIQPQRRPEQPIVDPFSGEGALSPRPQAPPSDDDDTMPDTSIYRPWRLQRGRGRPPMMLDLRRYDPRSGLWSGWAVAYPHLAAVEYTGDRLMTLDFGVRQFAIEGEGLSELSLRIQEGVVLGIYEYSQALWGTRQTGEAVTAIRLLTTIPRQG